MWGPQLIAKLVHITSITMVLIRITTVSMGFVNQFITGGAHIVPRCSMWVCPWDCHHFPCQIPILLHPVRLINPMKPFNYIFPINPIIIAKNSIKLTKCSSSRLPIDQGSIAWQLPGPPPVTSDAPTAPGRAAETQHLPAPVQAHQIKQGMIGEVLNDVK